MTLITNLILEDKIIIAADQLVRQWNPRTGQMGDSSFVNKLIIADNYVIGPQGSLVTGTDYRNMLIHFAFNNPFLAPQALIDGIQELLVEVQNDERVVEFNLTVSGFYDNEVFSHYLNIKEGTSKNLITDNSKIILNGGATDSEITNQALISINNFLRVKGNHEIERLNDILNFDLQFLLHTLENLYSRFNANTDARFQMIGGLIDYCEITRKGIIKYVVDLSKRSYYALIAVDDNLDKDLFYQDPQLRDNKLSIGWGISDPFDYFNENELFEKIFADNEIPDDTEHNARNGARSLNLFKKLKPGDIIFVRGEASIIDVVEVIGVAEFNRHLNHHPDGTYNTFVRFRQLTPGHQIILPVSELPEPIRKEFIFINGRSRAFKEIEPQLTISLLLSIIGNFGNPL
jgi:hypothetical protein